MAKMHILIFYIKNLKSISCQMHSSIALFFAPNKSRAHRVRFWFYRVIKIEQQILVL